MRLMTGLLATAALALANPAAAQDGASLAQKFGALESVQQISLSPSGDHVAYIAPVGEGASRLFVVSLLANDPPRPVFEVNGGGESLRRCRWASEDQIVCTVSVITKQAGEFFGFSRQLVISRDGKRMEKLTARTNGRALYGTFYGGSVIDWDLNNQPGKVLMDRWFVPQETIGTNIRKEEEGLGVEEVDVVKLTRRTVERPRADAIEYITDGHGNVRIMGLQPRDADGYQRERMTYLYRKADSREWEQLVRLKILAGSQVDNFNPYAVDQARNVVFGFDDNNGFQALYSISLDGNFTREKVLSRPDVDVDALVRIGRDQRVVGASYATERRMVEYFDPELKRLSAALRNALPGKPEVGFVDASRGEGRLLMFASSDVDPGTFYRFDKATRQLSPLLAAREELAGLKMGEMKPVSFRAADGTMVPGYLTLPPGSSGKNLPAIVMPHGGPSARDEWGFDWLVQFFAQRGFAVLQPNFRGSSGYGSVWYQKNGFQSWQVSVGDVNDAGRWLISQGIAAPDKLGIVGWSYGGYAALQSQVLDANLYKAVVAIAPVTDLERLRGDSFNDANFKLVDAFIGNGPHIKAGSPAQQAEAFKAPVLLFHGDLDSNVRIGQSQLMRDRLARAGKSVELVEFAGLNHQLPSANARTTMLARSDAFLRKAMGLPAN